MYIFPFNVENSLVKMGVKDVRVPVMSQQGNTIYSSLPP